MKAQDIDTLVRDLTQVAPRSKSEVRRRIQELLAAHKREISHDLCKKFDSLESTDPDKSTKNWLNYKFIRNSIRDFFLIP